MLGERLKEADKKIGDEKESTIDSKDSPPGGEGLLTDNMMQVIVLLERRRKELESRLNAIKIQFMGVKPAEMGPLKKLGTGTGETQV
jgi:hypothetical protein